MKTIIKVIIAALLLGCLLKVPYGYFQFVRIAACAGFIYLAWQEFESKNSILGVLWAACAILFNPIYKIHFTRKVWNQIDVVVAVALLICLIIELYLQYGKSSKKEVQ